MRQHRNQTMKPFVLGALCALALPLLVPHAATAQVADITVHPDKTKQPLSHWIRYTPTPPSPTTVPESAEGQPADLSAYKDKPVLVNYWATWCPPCIKEMPSLNTLAGELNKDKDSPFLVLSMNRNEEPEHVMDWMDQHGYHNLHVVYDRNKAMFNEVAVPGTVNGIPLTILYDAKGKEIARWWDEADWASPKMVKEIEDLIEQSTATSGGSK